MGEQVQSSDDAAVDGAADVLLPTQLGSPSPLHRNEPEARLALAVIEDAVLTLRLASASRDRHARILAAEARAWILSDDTTHPFAFVPLCEYLGLEPGWLRAGVRRRIIGGVRHERMDEAVGGRARRVRGRERAPSDAA